MIKLKILIEQLFFKFIVFNIYAMFPVITLEYSNAKIYWVSLCIGVFGFILNI